MAKAAEPTVLPPGVRVLREVAGQVLVECQAHVDVRKRERGDLLCGFCKLTSPLDRRVKMLLPGPVVEADRWEPPPAPQASLF